MMIFSVLMSGLLMSFAWPVRGQFGHWRGALITGAIAALAVCALSRKSNWQQSFAQAVSFGSLGFAVMGDAFSYGSLVDSIIAAPSLISVWSELIHVFLIGALWGGFGAIILGWSCHEETLQGKDYAVTLGSVSLVAIAVILVLPGVRIKVLVAGLYLALHFYNVLVKKSDLIRLFGWYGFFGFGFGFLISVVILWYGSHNYFSGTWWQLRDQIWGFIGGAVLMVAAWKAIQRKFEPSPVRATWMQRFGFIFFMVVITGFNTYNVYQKWFQSSPPVSDTNLALGILTLSVFCMISWLIYFLFSKPEIFSLPKLLKTILWSSLFFIVWMALLAIAKSIVYSGWGVWETAFTLFLADIVIFSVTLPIFLRD